MAADGGKGKSVKHGSIKLSRSTNLHDDHNKLMTVHDILVIKQSKSRLVR